VNPRPYLQWVGGKYAVAPRIAPLLPADLRSRTYREPFFGAGGMFFWLVGAGLVDPDLAELSDGEAPLVACHRAVASSAVEVMRELDALTAAERAVVPSDAFPEPGRQTYEAARLRFNRARPALPAAPLAALLIYLNKCGFNGLYRTNRRGELNVPWGKRERVTLYDRDVLLACSRALSSATVLCGDFERVLAECAMPGDAVYLDPPYVPLSATSSFTGYGGGWADTDHERLGRVFRALDARGCLLALSNSDTDRVRAIYAGYDFVELDVRRSVSAAAGSRVKAREVVVRNLARWPASAFDPEPIADPTHASWDEPVYDASGNVAGYEIVRSGSKVEEQWDEIVNDEAEVPWEQD
jgi:DNA adenine methylase